MGAPHFWHPSPPLGHHYKQYPNTTDISKCSKSDYAFLVTMKKNKKCPKVSRARVSNGNKRDLRALLAGGKNWLSLREAFTREAFPGSYHTEPCVFLAPNRSSFWMRSEITRTKVASSSLDVDLLPELLRPWFTACEWCWARGKSTLKRVSWLSLETVLLRFCYMAYIQWPILY